MKLSGDKLPFFIYNPMKSYRHSFSRIVVFAVLILVFIVCRDNQDYRVPDFTLTDVFGNDVNLYTLLRKGPVLTISWALWAKMSIKELDVLLAYANELNSMDITVLAINEDAKRSGFEILRFAFEHDWIFHYRILLDTCGIFMDLYDIQVLPTTIAINRNGEICFKWIGYKSGDEIHIIDSLRALLDK